MKHLMKKAVKAAVFAALTTLALTAFASAEGEMAIGAGCTTGTSLRMRSEPNTSSAIVTTLNKSVAVVSPLDDVLSTATHFVLRTYKELGVFVSLDEMDEREVATL